MLALAGALGGLLLVFAGRYGYHRDELYFLAAGRHLAWGYPDQPPLVPLLARLLNELAPGSLVALRLPSAFAVAGVVAVTGLIARELGAERKAQILAAASMAVAPLLSGAGHLLSTTTYDLLGWTLLSWLFLRILQTGRDSLWVYAGLVAGVTLLANSLVVFLVAAFLIGVLISGPRRMFASSWPWAGGAIALALWAPYVVWQARHGWPQLTVATNIANGGSGTSEPRWLFVPFQLGLVSPWLVPVWVAGLVRLWREVRLRAFAWTYAILLVVFIVTGGKPYYLGGMFPLLLAAGAQPTVDWVRCGLARRRRVLLGAAYGLSVPALLITLPIVPVGQLHSTGITSANYDAGETVGWPGYVREIAAVYAELSPTQRTHAAVVTSNYGEAGAIDRYGASVGLPYAYSGHNGYWYWGPPPASTSTVVAVGFDATFLMRSFESVRLAARLDNRFHLDNDERNVPVWVCSGPSADWHTLWGHLKNTG